MNAVTDESSYQAVDPEHGTSTEVHGLLQLILEDPSRMEVIREAAQEIIQCDQESKTINQRRATARDRVAEIGISKAAFKRAVSRFKLMETDREEQELSYQICVRALGVEHQQSLPDQIYETPPAATGFSLSN